MRTLALVVGGLLAITGCSWKELPNGVTESEASAYDCRSDQRRCIPVLPHDQDRLGLYLIGTTKQIQDQQCPEYLGTSGATWYGDLQAPPVTCPICSCGESTCMPAGSVYVAPAACYSADPVLKLDSPDAWQGACTTDDPVLANELCDGILCVGSLVVPKPEVSCPPIAIGEIVRPAPVWGLMAKQCRASVKPEGCGEGEVCVPSVPPGGDLAMCYLHFGDDGEPCKYADYPRRFVFHASAKDTRTCSECTCGEPEGAMCSTQVSVFDNSACSGAPLGAVTVTTNVGSACVDLPQGSPLASRSATVDLQQTGQCQPAGGQAEGDFTYNNTVVLCCEEPPDEAE